MCFSVQEEMFHEFIVYRINTILNDAITTMNNSFMGGNAGQL